MTKKKTITGILLILIFIGLALVLYYFVSKGKEPKHNSSKFYNIKSAWVDSLVKNMSIEEKLGNLLIFDAGKINNSNIPVIDILIKKYHIGGLIFETDSINEYVSIVNHCQKISEIPLLIILKTNNSYPAFFYNAVKIPDQLTIDAVQDDSLKIRLSKTKNKIYKSLGINLTFLPFHKYYNKRNINNDIGFSKVCSSDSVLTCCVNSSSYKDSLFVKLIKSDIPVVLLPKEKKIDSLNNYFISNYLRDSLSYKGLVISQINNISQTKDYINSSSDFILTSKNIDKLLSFLKNMYAEDILSIDDINKRIIRILKAKVWTGSVNYKKNNISKAENDLNNIKIKQLSRKLTNRSVTVVNNSNDFLPVKNINKKIFIYNIGNYFNYFNEQTKYYQTNFNYKYITPDTFSIKNIKFFDDFDYFIINIDLQKFNKKLASYLVKLIEKNSSKKIAVFVYGNKKIDDNLLSIKILSQLYNNNKTEQELASQLFFGGISAQGILPYDLKYKPQKTKKIRLGYTIPEEFLIDGKFIEKIDSIVKDAISRNTFPGCQIFLAKQGKVILNKSYGYHSYAKQIKVKWDDLYDIASVTKIAATTLATMKMIEQGKLRLQQNIEKYFKNTHIEYTRIKTDTTIDIDTVNITKLSKKKIKKLVDKKDTIHLNDSLIVIYDTVYWKATPKINVFKRNVKQMLMHRSGLPPSMPILRYIMYAKDTNITLPDSFKIDYGKYVYFDTLRNFNDTVLYTFNKYFTRNYIKDTATLQIARNIYLRKEYEDTLWIDTKQIKVYSKEVFMYSDVNPIIVQRTIDTINNYSIDKYLKKYFYNQLGCRTIGYLPLKHFKRNKITPTENDRYWRGQVLQGYVHDPSAALMGGVAGNAGLFSNATDLGIVFQMLLNGGIYGGKKYLNYKTINNFTQYQQGTARGIGFDKGTKKNIIAPSASPNSYGHTGFTGTCVWVDPDIKLVYVFLSNRVHPSAKNWKINTYKIRQKVHQTVYDAIKQNANK